ncbi:hypothetical protein B0O99DRAFT_746822 [Bisporella sp. PMI_857]|nr:hypothetical protein B0O99DRAFT_746822 [Bisporella sp. PMI_857]
MLSSKCISIIAIMVTSAMSSPTALPLLPRDANGDVIDTSVEPRAGAARYLNFYKDDNCQNFISQIEVVPGMYSWDGCDEAVSGANSAFAYFYSGQSVKLNFGGLREWSSASSNFYCLPHEQKVLKDGCQGRPGKSGIKGYSISSK